MGAQVIIDQFLSAAEDKWLQQTGLVALLPHCYDGQGAEHSSCRIERFLQACDDDEDLPPPKDDITGWTLRQAQTINWQVMNLTTPANYYHALRRQLNRDFRKPLIIASPKSYLRHRANTSNLEDMGPNSSFQRVIDERDPSIKPEEVTRVVFCTGKIVYELQNRRDELGLKNVALVTVEQISPFPYDKIYETFQKYKNV